MMAARHLSLSLFVGLLAAIALLYWDDLELLRESITSVNRVRVQGQDAENEAKRVRGQNDTNNATAFLPQESTVQLKRITFDASAVNRSQIVCTVWIQPTIKILEYNIDDKHQGRIEDSHEAVACDEARTEVGELTQDLLTYPCDR